MRITHFIAGLLGRPRPESRERSALSKLFSKRLPGLPPGTKRVHSIGYSEPDTRKSGTVFCRQETWGFVEPTGKTFLVIGKPAEPTNFWRRIITAGLHLLIYRRTNTFRVEWIKFYIPGTGLPERNYIGLPRTESRFHWQKGLIELWPANDTSTIP